MRASLALVCAAFLAAPAQAGLLVNGSFDDVPFFTGWTPFGPTTSLQLQVGNNTDGLSRAAVYTGSSLGGLFQTVSTTPGASYTVQFDLYTAGFSFDRTWEVSFGDQQLLTGGFFGSLWTRYTYDVVASGPSSELRFSFLTLNSDIYIDRVSVTGPSAPAVPEPATWALMLCGLGTIGWSLRRTRRTSLRRQQCCKRRSVAEAGGSI
ncbi:PEPxxWA-CTERM sorting domain-containing protein [Sphingomonas humi]|uniref:Ice-binding protein C-terminal domain-containing protein n=1 Tax=Sphingomonas humi TaxID=335630 RepID=A0ABP7RFE5_9SPHN